MSPGSLHQDGVVVALFVDEGGDGQFLKIRPNWVESRRADHPSVPTVERSGTVPV